MATQPKNTMDLSKLKKELPYKWRVQSTKGKYATCVAYVDSRDAQDLLDAVCGPESWQDDYREVKGNMFAGIGIKCGDEWIWKWDCGTESNIEAKKGEASDSFKRAAVKWGIGRFLYSLRIVMLKKDKDGLLADDGKQLWASDLTDYINNMTKERRESFPPTTASAPQRIPNAPPARREPKQLTEKQYKGLVETITVMVGQVQRGEINPNIVAKRIGDSDLTDADKKGAIRDLDGVVKVLKENKKNQNN